MAFPNGPLFPFKMHPGGGPQIEILWVGRDVLDWMDRHSCRIIGSKAGLLGLALKVKLVEYLTASCPPP